MKDDWNFIGRESEAEYLKLVRETKCPAIIVVHGRRRVGKTTLIEQTFKKANVLKIEGLENRPQSEQLENFVFQLATKLNDFKLRMIKLNSWTEAFLLLNEYVKSGRWIVYLEEFQWLANYENTLISELKFAWDNYLSKNKKLLLVLCGSSPSFMIEKVMKSQALYNRSLYELPLKELEFSDALKLLPRSMSKEEKLDSYLAVGGIPIYLKYFKDESSAYLSLSKNSFRPGAFFLEEADRIFISSLSKNPDYRKIVKLLAKVKNATRKEICDKIGLKSGGFTTRLFEDLESCGFIGNYSPFGFSESRRESKYYITDNYLQFYYRFVEPRLSAIRRGDYAKNTEKVFPHQTYRQWLGYAFERFCLKNHVQIAKLLGFESVEYDVGPYYLRNTDKNSQGLQIDLAFKRKDKVITICEIKYTDKQPDLSLVKDIERKISILKIKDLKFSIRNVLITLKSPTKKLLDSGYFERILTIKDFIK